MPFHAHTGLPLQSSPVSTRKGQGGGEGAGGGDVNMLFHAHTGLPLQSSPVSTRKGQGGMGHEGGGGGMSTCCSMHTPAYHYNLVQ